jgi:hypothetical protein
MSSSQVLNASELDGKLINIDGENFRIETPENGEAGGATLTMEPDNDEAGKLRIYGADTLLLSSAHLVALLAARAPNGHSS